MGRINPLVEAFLMQYVPRPNMDMSGMSGGADSNNYLDVRNETHFQNQGTVRIDHNFQMAILSLVAIPSEQKMVFLRAAV